MKAYFYLLTSLSVLFGCDNQSISSNEIKIGAVFSLTGPAGEQGENIRKGIELAVYEENKNGGKVRLIIEDDGTVPAKVVAGMNKLIDQDKVSGIVGGVWDFLAASAYPVALKREILFITPTNPIEIIPDKYQNSKYISSIAPTLESEFQAMKRFIKRHSPKTALVVYPQLPFGVSKKDAFEKAAKELGVKVIESSGFTEDENRGDAMKRASLKLSKANPDVALIITDYAGLSVLAKENVKLGVKTKILTSQHLDQAVLFSNQPELFINIFGLYPKIYDQDFVDRFQMKFKEMPKVFASHGYDAAKLLLAEPNKKFLGVTGLCQKGENLGCNGDTVLMGIGANGELISLD